MTGADAAARLSCRLLHVLPLAVLPVLLDADFTASCTQYTPFCSQMMGKESPCRVATTLPDQASCK